VTKRCGKCFTDLPIDDFYPKRSGRRPGARQSYCKACSLLSVKTPRGRAQAVARARRYGKKSNKGAEWRRAFRATQEGKDAIKKYNQSPAAKAARARWFAGRGKTYLRERRQRDPYFLMACVLRRRQHTHLKGRSSAGSFVRDMGCSRAELIARIERLFQPGMSWENYGQWHLDHDIPLCAFDLTNREQFLAACSYQNLVPMWAEENRLKGDSLSWPIAKQTLGVGVQVRTVTI